MSSSGVIIGSVVFLLFSLFFVFFTIVFNRRIINHKEDIDRIELSKKRELLKATIETQENERVRIGANIHDDLGPMLSTLKLQLQRIKSCIPKDDDNCVLKIQEAQLFIDDIISYVRKISRDLVPNVLYELGLNNALEHINEKMGELFNGEIEYRNNFNLDQLSKEKQLAIYRIIQEGFNNILNHANADKIELSVEQVENNIIINLSDNGNGCSIDNKVFGLGLRNINARTETLAGHFKFDSSLGYGTTIHITIPI